MPKAEEPKIKSLRDFLLLMEAPETIRARLGSPIGAAEATNDAWSVLANESSVSAQEIFRKLESLGLDGVWRSVSAYTKKVDSLSVEASVGFDISTPIAEVGLEASAGLTLGKSFTELSLILQLPSEIDLGFYSPGGLLFNSHAWHNWPLIINRPILLSKLSGGGVVVKGNISATAGFSFSVPLPDSAKQKLGDIFSQILSNPKAASIAPYEDNFYSAMDEVSLSIELGANFNIGCDFDYLYITDLQPTQYLNTRSSEFQTELESNIGIGGRNAELKSIHTLIINHYSTHEFKSNTKIVEILTLAKSLQALPLEKISISQTIGLINCALLFENNEAVKNQEWINKLNNFNINTQLVVSSLIRSNYNVALDKIQSRFILMGYQNTTIINDQSIAGSICNSASDGLKIKTSNYSAPFIFNKTSGILGLNKKNIITLEGSPETKINDIRFLPSNSFTARVRSNQSSNSNIKTSLSYFSSQPNADASLSASALFLSAEVSASAKVKFSRYRFQTSFLTEGLNPGILTQDTRVRYTQMLANFTASAAKKSTESEKGYQSISYKSANFLWVENDLRPYDAGMAVWGTTLFSPALPGSGLSYGCSISLNSINKLINPIAGESTFKSSLCNDLNVEQSDLDLFIQALKQTGLINQLISNCQAGNQGTNMFLIESSIAIIGGYAGVNKKERPGNTPEITISKQLFKNFEQLFKQKNPQSEISFLTDQNNPVSVSGNGLGADIGTPPVFLVKNIYLRQRNADILNLKDKSYKLGTIPLGVVNIGITYNASLDVGAQGVTTLFEFDIFKAKYTDKPSFINNYNFQVPPSTLFFQ